MRNGRRSGRRRAGDQRRQCRRVLLFSTTHAHYSVRQARYRAAGHSQAETRQVQTAVLAYGKLAVLVWRPMGTEWDGDRTGVGANCAPVTCSRAHDHRGRTIRGRTIIEGATISKGGGLNPRITVEVGSGT